VDQNDQSSRLETAGTTGDEMPFVGPDSTTNGRAFGLPIRGSFIFRSKSVALHPNRIKPDRRAQAPERP